MYAPSDQQAQNQTLKEMNESHDQLVLIKMKKENPSVSLVNQEKFHILREVKAVKLVQ